MNKKALLGNWVVLIILVAIFSALMIIFYSTFTGGFMSQINFQIRAFYWVHFLKRIFSRVPRIAKDFFGFYPRIGGKLEVTTEGWRELKGKKDFGNFLFKRAALTWGSLNTNFPLLESREKKTLTTFTDFIRLKEKTHVKEVLDYIDKTYVNESEDMKIGLIKITKNNVSELIDPEAEFGGELPKEFAMEIVFSEWRVEKNPGGPLKCLSEEMELCYLKYEGREKSINYPYYKKEGRFKVSGQQEWEKNKDVYQELFQSHLCELTDLSSIKDVLKTSLYFIPFGLGGVLETIDTIVQYYSQVDVPCPYYETSCGYINKSLACCEDKIFVCINTDLKKTK